MIINKFFRRKTIHEPFQCIAELDFNNSIVKSIRREHIRDDKVIKLKGPKTFYEDSELETMKRQNTRLLVIEC